MTPAAEHAVRSAEHALNAHDRVSLDALPAPVDEPWWQQTRLTTLLHDLAHYADAHDLDFEAALRQARAWHRTDLAEQATYQTGEEVKLRNTPHQGVITAASSDQGAQLYEVRIIGKPYRRLLTSADLAPASAFPELAIDGIHLSTAVAAEHAFQQNVARSLRSPTPKATRNCKLLADTLSTWSGVPRDEIYLNAHRTVSPHPADVARPSHPGRPTTTPAESDLATPAPVRHATKGPTP